MTPAPRWTEASLTAAIDRHRRTWWRHDPGLAAAVRSDAGLLARAEAGALSTVDAFYRGPDPYVRNPALWTPERLSLHAQLVAAQVGVGTPPPEPVVYLTIGPMGSGKTTALRPVVQAHRFARGGGDQASLSRIAADDIREALPEYADGLGNELVTPECFDLTYDPVFEAVLSAGQDIVFDTIGTFNTAGQVTAAEHLRRLRAADYRVHVLLAEAPLAVCVSRARTRALSENGRLIKVEAHEYTHEQPARILQELLAVPDLVQEWIVIDTYSAGVPGSMLDASREYRLRYANLCDTLLGNA